MPPSRRVPATVVTGFLGAGKTSLVRHLLAHAQGRRLAVVVNEFGELGIDRELLLGCGDAGCGAEDIVELANGCLCCTVAQEFLPTLEALLDRPAPPEHILIETSGLALPKPLVQAFAWPEIRTRTTVDGVLSVIDAAALANGGLAADAAGLARQRAADPALAHDDPIEEVFADQLACADLVILNKADLVEKNRLGEIRRALEPRLRPGVELIAARHGAVAPEAALGLAAAAEDDLAARPALHDLDDGHDHDDFESFVVSRGPIADADALLGRVQTAVAVPGVLRVKGFVEIPGRERRLLVQAVGTRIDRHFDRPWVPGEARESRFVVIGLRGLDRAAVAAALGA